MKQIWLFFCLFVSLNIVIFEHVSQTNRQLIQLGANKIGPGNYMLTQNANTILRQNTLLLLLGQSSDRYLF